MLLAIDAKRTIADLKTLAAFGKFESGVNRRALTLEDIAARAWLMGRMQAANLEASIDGIGNVIGVTPGCQRYIIIASHSDTVPKGGWLDGAMGVIFGLEIARALVETGESTDIGIKVISFNDEEGRFAGLLGSSVFCGLKTLDQVAELSTEDGITLNDALQKAGYAGQTIVTFDPVQDIAYLEAHIEQGPVLESNNRKIGIVTEIIGAERARVLFFGQSDHAGTTPMVMRKDAAAALYEFAVRFAEFCREYGSDSTVWNLGYARLEPGAYNVVARESELYIEYRDTSTEILGRIRKAIPELAAEIGTKFNVSHQFFPGICISPEVMDLKLLERIEAAAGRCNASCMRMPSGGGHDAMLFARKVPTAMMFVPSIGGRSHDVAEDTHEADINLGLNVLGEIVSDIIDNGLSVSNK